MRSVKFSVKFKVELLLFVSFVLTCAVMAAEWTNNNPDTNVNPPTTPTVIIRDKKTAVVQRHSGGGGIDNFTRGWTGMVSLQIGADGDATGTVNNNFRPSDPVVVNNITAFGLGDWGDFGAANPNGRVQIGGNGASGRLGYAGEVNGFIALEHDGDAAGSIIVQVGGNASQTGTNGGGRGIVKSITLTVTKATTKKVDLSIIAGGEGKNTSRGGAGEIKGAVMMNNRSETGGNSLTINELSSLGEAANLVAVTMNARMGNNITNLRGATFVGDFLMMTQGGDNNLTNSGVAKITNIDLFTTQEANKSNNNTLLNRGTITATNITLAGVNKTTANSGENTLDNSGVINVTKTLLYGARNTLLVNAADNVDKNVSITGETELYSDIKGNNTVSVIGYGFDNTPEKTSTATVSKLVLRNDAGSKNIINMSGNSKITELDIVTNAVGLGGITYNFGNVTKDATYDNMTIGGLNTIRGGGGLPTDVINLYNGVFKNTNALINNGVMNFTNGVIDIDGTFINNGDLHFDLTNAKTMKEGAIITASDKITLNGTIANYQITLSGGKHNTVYELMRSGPTVGIDNQSDIITQIDAYQSVMYKYKGEIVGANSLRVTSTIDNQQVTINALNSSIANKEIAIALCNIANLDNNPITLALENINDPATFGRAVSELNNANNASANTQVGQASTQQFNSTLAQVWADTRTNQLAAGFVTDGMKISASDDAKNKKSAAGGIPIDPITLLGSDYKWSGFAKAYGGFGKEATTTAAVGYDFGGVGFLAGIDYKVANEMRLGALFGYSYNHADLRENFGYSTDYLLRVGLYGSYQWESLFVNSAPTFGIHLLESQRNFTAANQFQPALGKRTGFDFNWLNQIGYAFSMPKDFIFTPSYTLAMTFMHDPSYIESGSAANLKVDTNNSWSLLQNMEFKLGKVIRLNNKWAFLPEVWGAWEHEYLTTNDVSMAFASIPQQSWQSPVKQIVPDRGVIGAGITTLLCDKYEFFGRWEQKIWDGGYSCNFTVGASMKF